MLSFQGYNLFDISARAQVYNTEHSNFVSFLFLFMNIKVIKRFNDERVFVFIFLFFSLSLVNNPDGVPRIILLLLLYIHKHSHRTSIHDLKVWYVPSSFNDDIDNFRKNNKLSEYGYGGARERSPLISRAVVTTFNQSHNKTTY